jgi:hypothetical protein
MSPKGEYLAERDHVPHVLRWNAWKSCSPSSLSRLSLSYSHAQYALSHYSQHSVLYEKADKSSGTLLPLPALYLFGAPVNCLGCGKEASGWNFHLVSSITTLPPPPPPPPNRLSPLALPPNPAVDPLVNVYADASMGRIAPELLCDEVSGGGCGLWPRDMPPAVGMPPVLL